MLIKKRLYAFSVKVFHVFTMVMLQSKEMQRRARRILQWKLRASKSQDKSQAATNACHRARLSVFECSQFGEGSKISSKAHIRKWTHKETSHLKLELLPSLRSCIHSLTSYARAPFPPAPLNRGHRLRAGFLQYGPCWEPLPDEH